jgi:dipeptidase E
MGGGGVCSEPDNPLLEEYILRQSGKPCPKVCFTSPACDDAYALRFYASFSKLNCRPYHLSLFKAPTADLESFLLEQDVIYVGGGNTRSMLALWREWRVDTIVRKAWEQGVILAGLSAGGICWFEQGLTDSVPGQLTAMACLGLLSGSCSPHYDGEINRRPTYHRLIGDGTLTDGWGIEDSVGLHFVGDHLQRIVASRPNKRAFRVALQQQQVTETPHNAKWLYQPS